MPTGEHAARFDRVLTHGRCVGIAIPEEPDLDAWLRCLAPSEQATAASLSKVRRRTWIAGRAAMRIALERSGLPVTGVASDDRGAPVLPPGVAGSISHKDHVAVALVARQDEDARLGVDVETAAPPRTDIARMVLADDEVGQLAGQDEDARARQVKLRFSAKEALYKALDPFVRRYVGFREVSVTPLSGGACTVRARLRADEGPFSIDVRWEAFDELLLTTARVVRVSAQ